MTIHEDRARPAGLLTLITAGLALWLGACSAPLPPPTEVPGEDGLGGGLQATSLAVDWYSPSGMYPGKGYSSVTGEIQGTCIRADLAPATIGPASADYRIDVASNSRELAQKLGVSSEASIGFGAFSASAKASYTRDQQANSSAVYIIARADIQGPSVNLINPRLMTAAEDPAGDDNAAAYRDDYLAFFSKCGDRYLDSAVTGATYRGVVRVETSSESEKTAVLAEVRARYGTAKGASSVERTVSELSSRYNVSVVEFYDGVLPDSFAKDPETLIANATEFPALFQKKCSGQLISSAQLSCLKVAVFQDYRKLTLTIPDTGAVTRARQAFDQMAEYGLEYQALLNDAMFARDNPHLFKDTAADLAAQAAEAGRRLTQARNSLEACSDNLRACLPAPDLTPPLPDPVTLTRPSWISVGQATSCADYRLKFRASGTSRPDHELPDGGYQLYVGTAAPHTARLWCRGMNTATPAEYLSLVGSNVSVYRDPPLPGAPVPMLTQVRWNKVRIDPATLIVDQQDFTYAAVVSGNDRRAIGFGTAVDALPGWYEGPRTFIKANVDLRGTDFHMDGVFTHVTGTLTGDAGISFPTPQQAEITAPIGGSAGVGGDQLNPGVLRLTVNN
ncbi:hypothetical protein [Deinococcus radiopugnans]|uniref:hypothetical protein n=1 Tax=Deinococcus radiopugnans TaxID=57497 RepID=UPI001116C863|nr:hypothetical protein [Deinococcus radiopugnans]